MSVNLDQIGLRSVAKEYDHFFIDVWGVVHDGINLHQGAVEVLNNLNELKKDYVLLTNAPRPNFVVLKFLEKMGLSKNHSKKEYDFSIDWKSILAPFWASCWVPR